jgi:hypothetical protein
MKHYILRGHEVVTTDSLAAWGRMFDDSDHRIVGFDMVEDVRVSTVFLGLDHNFGGGPPLLFETMVFGGEYDQQCDRYSTWDEAEAGHRAVVEALTVGNQPWKE